METQHPVQGPAERRKITDRALINSIYFSNGKYSPERSERRKTELADMRRIQDMRRKVQFYDSNPVDPRVWENAVNYFAEKIDEINTRRGPKH